MVRPGRARNSTVRCDADWKLFPARFDRARRAAGGSSRVSQSGALCAYASLASFVDKLRPPTSAVTHQPIQAPSASDAIARRALIGAALVAIALRTWEAAESSLWLDELHTLSHAAQPSLSALLERVSSERVHVPLFFAFVQLFGDWEAGAWLRWIPISASLLTLVPLYALAREALGGARAAAVTAWLFACLPYFVHWGAELRPYACWGLFSAGAAWAAFSERRSLALRTAVFFACALAGIWTHRLMAVSVFSIGVARLFVRNPTMVPLWRLIVAGVVAFAPMGVWALQFAERATSDRLEYQEQIGGFRLRPVLLKEFAVLPLRLFAPFIGALGGAWALVVKLSGALFAVGCVLGLFSSREAGRTALGRPVLRALAIFALTHFVVIAAISWWTWDRLPLQYFTPVVWTLPVLLCAAFDIERRGLRGAALLVCVAALGLGIGQAGGRGVEDMRGAVAGARTIGAQLDSPLYTALMSQPSLFEHVLPYRAYGADLDFREPTALPTPGDADFARPVIVLRRGQIRVGDPPWKPLLEGRRVLEERRIDAYLTLFVLTPQ